MIEDVIFRSLKRWIDRLGPSEFGLRSHAFPTEDHLDDCVRAAASLLNEPKISGARFVIGSSKHATVAAPPNVTVLEPHAAAAAATRLRNNSSTSGGPGLLVYLNTDSTPGEAGLTVLTEVTPEMIAEAYAESAGLKVLEDLATRKARLVRTRVADTSVATLADYAALARNAGEARSMPLLGLIPARQPKVLPGPTPARELDLLRGVKSAATIKSVIERLGRLREEDKEAVERILAATLLPDVELPIAEATKLAHAAHKFATGASESAGELCGMTVEFARLLRRGARALDVASGEGETATDEADETRADGYTDEALLEEHPDAFRSGQIHGEPAESDDEDPAFSVAIGSRSSIALRAATPRGLLRALMASKDPALLNRYLRYGECIEVTEAAQLKSSRRILTVKFRGRNSGVEAAEGLAPQLRDAINQFLEARADLLRATADLLKSGDTSTDELEGDDSNAGSLLALAMLDSHPLIVAARLSALATSYADAYQALITATYPSGAPTQAIIEWLANLDLAFAVEGTSVTEARLLPLHPLRVARALLWLQNGAAPPAMPPRLAMLYDRAQTLLPDNVADSYNVTSRAWPSSRGVALAVREGLGAIWSLLAPRRLASAVSVDLVDLTDTAAALDALCAEARRRFEEDADVGDGLHLEVRVIFTDPKRVQLWQLDRGDLSLVAREALDASRGDGVSLVLPRHAVEPNDDHFCHLAIQAVATPYSRLDDDGSSGSGLPLAYVPGPNGNVASIRLRGVPWLEAYDTLLDGLDLAHRPTGLNPTIAPAEIGGAIVRAMVACGGWPLNPTPDTNLVSYGEVDGHVAAVLCDRDSLRRDLTAALERVTRSAAGIDLSQLRSAVLSLYSCRRLLADLLERVDARQLRGQIALTRAFLAARSAETTPTLPVSLDCPEGHRWARAVQRHFDVDRSRADLVLVEAGDSALTSIKQLRVVELKSRQTNASFSTLADRDHLSRQARVAAARIRASFEVASGAEPKSALQRLAWMEASRQRLATIWRNALPALDRQLQASVCPRIVVECWIVPEEAWSGESTFEEEHPTLTVQGEPRPGEMVTVRFVVMPPLSVAEPPPRSSRPPPRSGSRARAAETHEAKSAVLAESRELPDSSGAAVEHTSAEAPSTTGSSTAVARASAPIEAPTPASTASPSSDVVEGIVVRIGDLVQAGRSMPAIWTPNRVDRVNHYNVGITGTMGTGKTQLTKSLLAQLVGQGARNPGGKPPGVLVFDYKGDYGLKTRDDFPKRIGANVLKPEGLPLNPLRPSAPESKQDLTRMVYAFADTLLAIEPRIGRVQRDQIVKGVQACLTNAGIDASDPSTFDRPFPTINDLLEVLIERDLAAGSPQSLLSELVDLGVFAEDAPEVDIGALLDGINVIDLQPLAGMRPTIRAIIAFFMNAFYRQMLREPEAPLTPGAGRGKELRQLRRLILVDEADDFLGLNVESLRYILQQGRSFGCGVILSTQFLSHFDQAGDEVKSSIGTWILHQMANVERKTVAALFSLSNRDEAATIAAKIGSLEKHTSLCRGLSTDGCRDKLVTVQDLAFKDLAFP